MTPPRHFSSDDRFRVIRQLDAGGQGAALLAEDRVLGRQVVLKRLRESTPIGELRLEREAQALSQVNHPNVVDVFDIIERDDDVYVVMEYVEGRTLKEIIKSGPVSLEQAVSVMIQVARGIEAVHERGIVHRDLKPANIMVTADGTVKILDFGLAHFAGRTTLNIDDHIVGTPAYMSPEQVGGGEVTGGSDLFACGVILYELLAGALPYEATTPQELMAQIVAAPPVRLRDRRPDLSRELDAIVEKALQKDRWDRFGDAREFGDALSRFAASGKLAIDDATVEFGRAPQKGWFEHWRPTPWALLVGVIVIVLVARGLMRDESASLLILPFEVEAASLEHAWLSTGIMDNLIQTLQEAEGIRVVSRETVASALAARDPVRAGVSLEHARGIASRVAADYVLTGEIMSSREGRGSPVQIRCVLRHLEPGRTIERWDFEVASLETGLLPAIDRLAAEIAEDLGVKLAARSTGPESTVLYTHSVNAQSHFERGLAAYRMQDIDVAEREFRAAVAIDSTYTRAYWYLFWTETDHAQATEALDRAMMFRLSAPEPLRSILRATHLARLGERDQAIEVYEQVLETHPVSIEARLALAKLYAEADRYADAVGEYDAARVQNPFDYSFYPNLAMAHIELGHTRAAIELFEKWRGENPRELAPLIWLVRLEAAVGNGLQALALCDSIDAISEGAAPGMRGAVLRDVGRVREAEAEFLRLKESPPARWRPNAAQVLLAHLALTRERPEDGLRWIDEAIEIQDDTYARNTAGHLAVLGGDLLLAGRHLEAIAGMIGDDYADTTLVQEMGNRRWYFDLAGEIALARGDADEAVRLRRSAARYAGRWDGATFNEGLARAYLASGDTVAAMTAFERSISLQKTFPDGVLGLARVQIDQGDRAGAMTTLEPLVTQWQEADADYVKFQRFNELLAEVEDR